MGDPVRNEIEVEMSHSGMQMLGEQVPPDDVCRLAAQEFVCAVFRSNSSLNLERCLPFVVSPPTDEVNNHGTFDRD